MAQPLALAQCMIHQAELALRQVTKPAMNQLRRVGGSRAGKIALINHRGVETAHGGIACDRRTGNSAANDGDIEAFSL